MAELETGGKLAGTTLPDHPRDLRSDPLVRRMRGYGTTIFAEMSELASREDIAARL